MATRGVSRGCWSGAECSAPCSGYMVSRKGPAHWHSKREAMLVNTAHSRADLTCEKVRVQTSNGKMRFCSSAPRGLAASAT